MKNKNISGKIDADIKIILINGRAGAGKSSIAVKLANEMGIKTVVDLDVIRDSLRIISSPGDNPYLFKHSRTAWQIVGDHCKESIIEGFINYSKELKPFVDNLIQLAKQNKKSIIIEGVHLLPQLYPSLAKNIIVINLDKAAMERNFESRIREQGPDIDWKREEFYEMSIIGDFIVGDAKKHGVTIFDNNADMSLIMDNIHNWMN